MSQNQSPIPTPRPSTGHNPTKSPTRSTPSPGIPRSLGELLASFVADCELRGMTSETMRSYRSNVRTFLSSLHERKRSPEDVGLDDLRIFLSFLKERKLSSPTIGNYFAAISTFYEYLSIEGLTSHNPVLGFRKRYLRGTHRDKRKRSEAKRRLLTVAEMSRLIRSTLNIRDKAIITLLAKTGVRRNELMQINTENIDHDQQSIILRPQAKRSSLAVFYDHETSIILGKWVKVRATIAARGEPALFVGDKGHRIGRNTVYKTVTQAAQKAGLHDPDSKNPLDHFSPHCCRHWFTTHLLRNGMPREYVKELRGDARSTDAIDIYYHIDREQLRKTYLGCIPELDL